MNLLQDNNCSPHTNFTSRCTQIRDAQWVCHCVNTVFPHTSTTKFKPIFAKYVMKTVPRIKTQPQDIGDIRRIIEDYHPFIITSDKIPSFIRDLANKIINFCLPEKTKKKFNILETIRFKIFDFGMKRIQSENETNTIQGSVMRMLAKYKMGNCFEDAVLSEFILKLNGIKNACTVHLEDNLRKIDLDHSACVFNKDGSPFTGEVTKNTIIIDSWLGIADFGDNMLKYWKDNLKNFILVNEDADIQIKPRVFIYMDDEQLSELSKKFEKFIFKSKNRKFMQNREEPIK